MPQFSVIVTVFNGQQFLHQCIESVLAQTVSDFELIIVDDGSTDRSAEIAGLYAGVEPRVKVFSTENCGVSLARNFGMSKAAGQWVTFLDADDCLYPDFLERTSHATKELNVAIAGMRLSHKPPGRERMGVGQSIKPIKWKVVPWQKAVEKSLKQLRGTDTSVCAKIFNKDVFENVEFEPGRFEDLDIFYKLFQKAGTIAVTDSPGYYYREVETSFIHSRDRRLFDILPVTERILDYFPNGKLNKAAKIRRFSGLCSVARIYAEDGECPENWSVRSKEMRKLSWTVLTAGRVRLKDRGVAVVAALSPKAFVHFCRLIKNILG